MIGAFGKIAFIATPEILRTFSDFTRNSAGRWGKHDRVGTQPLQQFIGPGLDTISFTMRFDVFYGLNPRKEVDELVRLERSGKAQALTIGGLPVGVNLWIITSMQQTWDVIDNFGNVLVGTARITLEEYV